MKVFSSSDKCGVEADGREFTLIPLHFEEVMWTKLALNILKKRMDRRPLVVSYINYERVFYSAHRRALMKILLFYHIPEKYEAISKKVHKSDLKRYLKDLFFWIEGRKWGKQLVSYWIRSWAGLRSMTIYMDHFEELCPKEHGEDYGRIWNKIGR